MLKNIIYHSIESICVNEQASVESIDTLSCHTFPLETVSLKAEFSEGFSTAPSAFANCTVDPLFKNLNIQAIYSANFLLDVPH